MNHGRIFLWLWHFIPSVLLSGMDAGDDIVKEAAVEHLAKSLYV